jgi:hypothetical protein
VEKHAEKTTQQFTFRIPAGLKGEIEKIAEAEDRSLSRQIISILRKYVDDKNSKK